MADTNPIGFPVGMLAELTHRCPLQCPYCSNPAKLLKAKAELSTEQWLRAFDEAASLGVLQVHLSGGEPTLRPDLADMIRFLQAKGVYTNLITTGVTLPDKKLESLAVAGLQHLQLSVQGTNEETIRLIGNYNGGFAKKLDVARKARQLGLPLTINAPIHRHNIDQVDAYIDLALELDADRLEIANVQYYGWAYLNRPTLMPTREKVERQIETVERARAALQGILAIDFVPPDYYADYPKPCMGGWANDAFVITPNGDMLPCHAAQTLSALSFDNVTKTPLSRIWYEGEAFNAYRGTSWMKEPCRSCPRRDLDFGGCRCQAFALTGDAAATDPACMLSPDHEKISAIAVANSTDHDKAFIYRRIS